MVFFFKCKECVSTALLQKVLVPLEASRLAQGVDTCPQAVPPGASVSQRLCGRPFPLPWRQTCHGPSWHVRCLPIQQGSASSNHTQGSCIRSSPQRLSQRRPRPAPFSLPRGLEGWGHVGESPALLAVCFLTLCCSRLLRCWARRRRLWRKSNCVHTGQPEASTMTGILLIG